MHRKTTDTTDAVDAYMAALDHPCKAEVEALRRYDLIRWGIYLSTMKDFADYVMANAPEKLQKSALAAQNLERKHLLFPIPIREISVNSALTQNLDW